jgi:hypothetical protein
MVASSRKEDLEVAIKNCTLKTIDSSDYCIKNIEQLPNNDNGTKLLNEYSQLISSKDQAELDRIFFEDFSNCDQTLALKSSDIINEEELQEQELIEAEFAIFSNKIGAFRSLKKKKAVQNRPGLNRILMTRCLRI